MCTWLPSRSSRAGRRGQSSFDCLCCCLVLISHRPWFRLFSPVLTRSTQTCIRLSRPGKYLNRGRLELELTPKAKGGRSGAEYGETGWAMGDRLVRALSLSLRVSAPASSKVFQALLWSYCSSAPGFPKEGRRAWPENDEDDRDKDIVVRANTGSVRYAWSGGDIHTVWHL